MRKILLMAAASIISAFCWGQVPEMGPSDEIKKFDWMVGEWHSKTVWTMPGMGEVKVESNMRVEWDGQFLRQTAKIDFDGMIMTELSMFGYDPYKEKYYSSSFTNMAPTPRIEWGTFEDDTLVMVSEPWQIRGDESVSRATLVKVSDDEIKFKLEFKYGDSWTVVSDSVFKRKK
ncbi:MAG: DUF1579 family protein [Proteobacteria bacterium]|nr:DUF1579 family protein [Pseudomonadota bacterium]